MRDNVFLDTNIFIYALTEPKIKDDIPKRQTAINLLQKLINQSNLFVSVQIMNELHMNMVRKFKIDDRVAFDTLQENMLAIASVESLDYQTYAIAFDVRQKYNISYWDSLVIASALESGCDTLYSEDMQDGQLIDGVLRIVNPF